MKKATLITALVFGITGVSVLLRCVSLSAALGGLEYGDFLQYYSIGTDPNTGEVWVDNYPTGEEPWYVYFFHFCPAWSLGFGCLGLSTASVVTYRKLRKQL